MAPLKRNGKGEQSHDCPARCASCDPSTDFSPTFQLSKKEQEPNASKTTHSARGPNNNPIIGPLGFAAKSPKQDLYKHSWRRSDSRRLAASHPTCNARCQRLGVAMPTIASTAGKTTSQMAPILRSLGLASRPKFEGGKYATTTRLLVYSACGWTNRKQWIFILTRCCRKPSQILGGGGGGLLVRAHEFQDCACKVQSYAAIIVMANSISFPIWGRNSQNGSEFSLGR